MRFVIISYYELRESLKFAADALVSAAADIFRDTEIKLSEYPLLQIKNEFENDGAKILKHFANFWSALGQTLNQDSHVVVIWWFFGISADLMSDMVSICRIGHRCCQCLFNWDDPFVWTHEDQHEMTKKSKLFDIVFASCSESLDWYKRHGAKHAVYVVPGFDPATHYPKTTTQTIDVSICCTNLYISDSEFPDQLKPTRFEIVRELAKAAAENKFTFAVYGPEHLAEHAGLCYKGFAKYEDTADIFASSKINICTHVVGKYKGYLSERVSLILGSGGLLWIDKTPQTLITDDHAVFIDSEIPIVDQVQAMLNNPEQLNRRRLTGYALAMSNLTWNHWAIKVLTNITTLVLMSADLNAASINEHKLAWFLADPRVAAMSLNRRQCESKTVDLKTEIYTSKAKTTKDVSRRAVTISEQHAIFLLSKLKAPSPQKLKTLVKLKTEVSKEMLYLMLSTEASESLNC